LLSNTTVASVIAGATKVEQVRANSAAATWRLTDLEMTELDAVLTSQRR
jgi:aryl-alcohol dehydrogenase-like predicted oxidoreductase